MNIQTPAAKPLSGRWLPAWLFVVLVMFSLPAFARVKSQPQGMQTGYSFKTLNINDGLSQNFVSAICQDDTGFLWIGTKDGLNMYDGYSFTIFKHNPFEPNSLSDNFVQVIFCDQQGRLWIGTLNGGLNLLDRSSGNFIRFVHDPDNPNSISNNNITAIVDDQFGNIWVGTSQGGLNKISFLVSEFIPQSENISVQRFDAASDGLSFDEITISSLFRDSNNAIWIGSNRKTFKLENSREKDHFTEVKWQLSGQSDFLSPTDYDMTEGRILVFQDHKATTWMLSRVGLFRYNMSAGIFVQFHYAHLPDSSDGYTYGPKAATAFLNKGINELWLSTEGGLTVLNPETGRLINMGNDPEYTENLANGNAISLLADMSGNMWVGSNGYGLSVYDPYKHKFIYPNDTGVASDGSFISSRDLSIRSFLESKDGMLWIGSNKGFFRINRATADMRQVKIYPSPDIKDLIVYSIREGDDGLLWLGTSAGLIRFNTKNETVNVFPTHLKENLIAEEPRVAYVHLSGNNIWILTPNTIARFDSSNGSFNHIRYNDEILDLYKEAVYPCLYEDSIGNFWLGTHNGLHHFDVSSSKLTHYTNDPQNMESLPFNNVRTILPDPIEPQKFLWLATGGGGLARFNLGNRTFQSYSEREGLANNMVYGLLDDKSGNFWLSTNNGISRFNIKEQSFHNYTVEDGLQSNEFNSGAFYAGDNGELFFGGIKGYNSFIPSQLIQKQFRAPVVFTGFTVISADEKQHDRFLNIAELNQIRLNYKQNNFLIAFSALDLASAEKNHFAYSFGKRGEQWIPLGTNHNITFTNLQPGHYTLKVRGTNNDGMWSEHVATMEIIIAKPWWGTILAWIFYALVFLTIVMGFRKYEIARLSLKNQMKLADLEAGKLKDIDAMKSKFFANISHEFRTPLTLIKGPLEQMLSEASEHQQKKILSVMYANTERMLVLINQILELSKLESGEYNLKVSRGGIVSFVKGFVMSFASLAEEKKIQLKFIEATSLKDPLVESEFYYDKDVLVKILTNILSNAFKFTPSGGKVTVTACLRTQKNGQKKFEITITDTGIGIAADKLPFIYDRFYQVDDSSKRAYEGTGIGLAYAKELVDLHKGHIAVMSKPGEGTTFRLRFPLGNYMFAMEQVEGAYGHSNGSHSDGNNHQAKSQFTEPNAGISDASSDRETDNNKPMVLVVEDHDEVREYIRNGLIDTCEVIEASNASDGLTMAVEHIPDLIISDVMMPGIDGFECCKQIKTNDITSHIPVILLTARADVKDKIQGLETGADDYLTKPFNTTELRLRVRNIIESRRLLREKFSDNEVIRPADISVTSRDQTFMEKLFRIVEQNIRKEQFSIEDFAKEAGMSQSQLNRKLKALINQSAVQFIRARRMHSARELLEKDAGNIADIAYLVGYGDPAYFTRTFKAFFGMPPSEIRKG